MAVAAAIDMERLYSSHSDWLRGWLRHRTRCPEKAADLVQDTFCKLMESRAADAPRNARPYLATVARRLLIDNARRMKVEQTFLDAHAALAEGATAPCPERIAAAIDELCVVMRALEMLPEKARRAFLLARLDGLSHAVIAAELNVSKSMIKQYVAKGYACCYAATYGVELA